MVDVEVPSFKRFSFQLDDSTGVIFCLNRPRLEWQFDKTWRTLLEENVPKKLLEPSME